MKKLVLSNVAVGKLIREKRIELNYTQDDLANELGITKTAISNWENGNSIVDVKYLVPLSNIFCVKIDDVLFPRQVGNEKKDYYDVSSQFQKMVSLKLTELSQCKKLLDLFIENKSKLVSLIKEYRQTRDETLINKIIAVNKFGFTYDDTLDGELLNKEKINVLIETDKPIEDCIETLWYPTLYCDIECEKFNSSEKKISHLFLSNSYLEWIASGNDGYGYEMDSNNAMLNLMFTIGGERIFRKFVSTFSQEYKNQLLYNLFYVSSSSGTRKLELKNSEKNAMKYLLRENAKLIIDEKDYTNELLLKIL